MPAQCGQRVAPGVALYLQPTQDLTIDSGTGFYFLCLVIAVLRLSNWGHDTQSLKGGVERSVAARSQSAQQRYRRGKELYLRGHYADAVHRDALGKLQGAMLLHCLHVFRVAAVEIGDRWDDGELQDRNRHQNLAEVGHARVPRLRGHSSALAAARQFRGFGVAEQRQGALPGSQDRMPVHRGGSPARRLQAGVPC